MWYAGIDWADTKHDVVVIDAAGRKVASLRVEHTASGLNKLIRFLRGIAPLDQIACVLETKHGLFITALLEAGIPLYPVNPKTIDRKRVASRAKTDQIDAYLLAKHGRSELADLRRLEPDSPKIAELKALTRDQDSLIVSQTRLVNQLTACLKAYYPSALSLFSKLQQPSTLVNVKRIVALPKIWGTVPAYCFDWCSVIYSWKRCKQGAPAFQEDDGAGKVPVSALTRRDGHWSG